MIYLDHNATTPVRPEVVDAMVSSLTQVSGNPSSLHGMGRIARDSVEMARQQVADLIGAQSQHLHFTSGGTEADNWAVKGAVAAARQARGGGPTRLVVTAIEHVAVLHPARYLAGLGVEVVEVPASGKGTVDVDALLDRATEGTALVSVMHANNETGVLQPLAEIAPVLRGRGVPLHVDAVQSIGKVPVLTGELGADLVSMSAHKLYGPKGVGALYVRPGTPVEPLAHGGAHEGGGRGGTENVPGIAGFGVAASLASAELTAVGPQTATLRDRLESGLLEAVAGATPHGAWAPRLPNTTCLSFPGLDGEALVTGLDLEGVACSSGSACSSGRYGPSHVLVAMAVPPHLAAASVRFSLGRDNTDAEIEEVLLRLPEVVDRLRRISGYGPTAGAGV